MSPAQLLATAVRLLEAAAVPYMVSGSYASSFHGEPRATLDLDIVIGPEPHSLERLVASLQDVGFYVDSGAASTALAERSEFNAIGADASKIDFVVCKDRPFSRTELARRMPADLLGTRGYIATVEDMIIVKLEWAAASDSERQLRDVEGMLAANVGALDEPYLDRWIRILGLSEIWQRVAGRA